MNPFLKALGRLLVPGESSEEMGRLASILELPIRDLATLPSDRRIHYRPFTIRKRSGKRVITAPSAYLKGLQRRLLRNYLDSLPVHPAACAYRRGGSIVSHARTHLNQKILLTADLQDFFSSTSTRRVREFYTELGWHGRPLEILVRLCVLHGGLPQGAPTSPALSNLINLELDDRLHELATIHGARYSRYSDDLAFSWSSPAVEPLAFRGSVAGLLQRYGYQIQLEKGWKLQHAANRPELTGIEIRGNRLRPRKELREERNRLRFWTWTKTKYQQARLAGLNGFAKQLRRKR